MNYETPEQFNTLQTAEGEQRQDRLPPCPDIIRGRQRRALWAKATTELSQKGPTSARQALQLEAVFIRFGMDLDGLQRAVERFIRQVK